MPYKIFPDKEVELNEPTPRILKKLKDLGIDNLIANEAAVVPLLNAIILDDDKSRLTILLESLFKVDLAGVDLQDVNVGVIKEGLYPFFGKWLFVSSS